MDLWSFGGVLCRIFSTTANGELMLSSSPSDYDLNSKVVTSIIDTSCKHKLLDHVCSCESKLLDHVIVVKDHVNSCEVKVKGESKAIYDILNKYVLVEEERRDKSMTDVMKHGYFNLHAISGLYGVVSFFFQIYILI